MISKLTGVIDTIATDHLILDVHGVGYRVFASGRTLSSIGGPGDRASLLIDTVVREDAFLLYGFASAAEQVWFRLLTSVQGVGARLGLAILSACAAEELMLAIAAQDKAMLVRADGVGPKLAVRILTELKDKAAGVSLAGGAPVTSKKGGGAGRAEAAAPQSLEIQQDAVSALVNLGYGRAEAFAAVQQVAARFSNDNTALSLEPLIRAALKELSAR